MLMILNLMMVFVSLFMLMNYDMIIMLLVWIIHAKCWWFEVVIVYIEFFVELYIKMMVNLLLNMCIVCHMFMHHKSWDIYIQLRWSNTLYSKWRCLWCFCCIMRWRPCCWWRYRMHVGVVSRRITWIGMSPNCICARCLLWSVIGIFVMLWICLCWWIMLKLNYLLS